MSKSRRAIFNRTQADIDRFLWLIDQWANSGIGLDAFFSGDKNTPVAYFERMSATAVYKTARRLGVEDRVPRPKNRLTTKLKAEALAAQRKGGIPLEVMAHRYGVKPSTLVTWARRDNRKVAGNTQKKRDLWWDQNVLCKMDAITSLEIATFCKIFDIPPYPAIREWHKKYKREATLWDVAGNFVDDELSVEEAREAIEDTLPCPLGHAPELLVWADGALHARRTPP